MEPDYTDYRQAIDAIRAGQEERVLKTLYREYLEAFIVFMSAQFRIQADEAIEILTQTLTIFWEKARNGNFPDLKNASLKTYLFSIGINLKLANLKAQKLKKARFGPESLETYTNSLSIEIELPWDEALEIQPILARLVQQLRPACTTILTLTILEKRPLSEVETSMGYKDSNSTAASQSRCLAELKTLIQKALSKDQLEAILHKLRL